MWHWLSIVALCSSALAGSEHGPKSREEAMVLWEEGKASYQNGDYATAVNQLKRLTDRYPGEKGFLEAHLLLGLSYQEQGQFEHSLKPLRYFHHADQKTDQGLKASLALSRAYCNTRRFSECLLLANESLTRSQSSLQRAEALVLKSTSLLGLQDEVRAEQSLETFKKAATADSDIVRFAAEAGAVEMELKVRSCNKLASRAPLDEILVQAQYKSRGQCLQEAFNLLRQHVEKTSGEAWHLKARDSLRQGIEKYSQVAWSPPRPPGKRTGEQLKLYSAELSQWMKRERQVFQKQLVNLAEEWKKSAPAAADRYVSPLVSAIDQDG